MHYSKKRQASGTGTLRKAAGGLIVAGVLVYAAANAGLLPFWGQEDGAVPASGEEGRVSATTGEGVSPTNDGGMPEGDSASAVLAGESAPRPSEKSSPEAALADCLTASGARLYGAEWCPHCQAQKAAFGDAVGLLNFIECADDSAPNGQSADCAAARINSYPTWVFGDGTRLTGERSMWELARKSGCEWGG